MLDYRFIATNTIIAHDLETGDIGIAVHSHHPGSCQRIMALTPAIGGIAVQARLSGDLKAIGLQMLRSGATATAVVSALVTADAFNERRQLGVIDTGGQIAMHTGARCIGLATHHVGEGYGILAHGLMDWQSRYDVRVESDEQALDQLQRLVNWQQAQHINHKGYDDLIAGNSATLLYVITHLFQGWSKPLPNLPALSSVYMQIHGIVDREHLHPNSRGVSVDKTNTCIGI